MSTAGSKGSPTTRMLALLAVAGSIALVGGVLRIGCVGKSCEEPASAASEVPFCGLPEDVRAAVTAGFRDGRSPDVLAVSHRPQVAGGTAFESPAGWPPWPSATAPGPEVPLVFSGTGVARSTEVPAAVTLDSVAPTLAKIIGLDRPHPEVRSGTAITGIGGGETPRLVLVVAMKGLGGSEPTEAMPVLDDLASDGIALTARPASLPLDPAALLTTIGTGGTPSEHGIVGSLVRNDSGRLVRAWSDQAPISVISTVADDLDELNAQRSLIGLIGTDEADRGLIGGNWYINNDQDDIEILEASEPKRVAKVASRLLQDGYGTDSTADLLAIAMEGEPVDMDAALDVILEAARLASDGSVAVVVIGTGEWSNDPNVEATEVVDAVNAAVGTDVVEAASPGGLFIDQDVLAEQAISEDEVLTALSGIEDANGDSLFDDVFTAIAVSFARYC